MFPWCNGTNVMPGVAPTFWIRSFANLQIASIGLNSSDDVELASTIDFRVICHCVWKIFIFDFVLGKLSNFNAACVHVPVIHKLHKNLIKNKHAQNLGWVWNLFRPRLHCIYVWIIKPYLTLFQADPSNETIAGHSGRNKIIGEFEKKIWFFSWSY